MGRVEVTTFAPVGLSLAAEIIGAIVNLHCDSGRVMDDPYFDPFGRCQFTVSLTVPTVAVTEFVEAVDVPVPVTVIV